MTERRQRFDALYRTRPDPWGFETSPYESEKYLETMSQLGPRYRRGLEIGCSIGVLTRMLSERCDTLLALDVSAVALDRARAREMPGRVRFERAEIPRDWPRGRFDLIVLSEILYFLSPAEVREVGVRTMEALEPGGTAIVVNWTGPCECELNGDEASTLFLEAVQARQPRIDQRDVRRDGYRIDLLVCHPADAG